MKRLTYVQGMTNGLPLMRRFAAFVTLLVCASFDFGCCASAQQSFPAGIVARWRSLETSKGGIGAICEFRSDGTVDFSPGAVVEMPWRIENNQLVLPSATDGGAERKGNIKWLGENKLTMGSEADFVELARVGDRADASNPILGEWIENREIAGRNLEAHWLFYPGGKLLFLMPFVTRHGSFTISGSALHVKMPGRSREFRFELRENLLTIVDPEGGHEDRYARY